MTTAIDRDLSARLNRLEREARWWRRGALALGLALFGAVGMSAAAPARTTAQGATSAQDEVRTRRLVLVDAEDTEVGLLELDGKGNPHLLLRKESRTGLLSLSGPGLLVRDGRRGAYLGLDSRGASQLELTGDDLTQGARVSVQEDGSTGFYVLDDTGRRRAGLEWLSSGHAQFAAYDAKGTLRVQQGVDPAGNASTALFDPVGVPRLGLVVPAEGAPTLASEDARGRTRAQLVQAFDGSATLEFSNEAGSVFWKEPK